MNSLPYTGNTTHLDERFPPVAPTEHLSQASAPTQPLTTAPIPVYRPYGVAVAFVVFLVLLYGAIELMWRVNNEAFTVAEAVLLAGYVYLAFGSEGE